MSAPELCPFPKHKGIPWEDILEEDRPYMEWLVSGSDGPDPPIDEELYELIMEHLEGEH